MPSVITPETILDFWFGHTSDTLSTARLQSRLWWAKDPALDNEVRTLFAPLLEDDPQRSVADWAHSAHGMLACILLFDQFPRTIYRDSPQAFAFDHLALKYAIHGLDREWDQLLRPIERVFFYLPLEHSEVLAYQERSVELFRKLITDVPGEEQATFAGYLGYAIRHRDIIDQFGRFPHRNDLLGRSSTTSEAFFLTQPGSSF